MKKADIQLIQDKLSVLMNEPLRSVGRGGGSIFIDFGDLIEKEVWDRDENGEKIGKKTIMIGKYDLHIECSARFICGDQVILAKYDLYSPTSEEGKKEDFDWDTFDWDIRGGNRFDELVSNYFVQSPLEFIVKKIEISRVGDIRIKFTNDFILEIIIDTSIDDECWRFFEYKSDEHLVVSGQGIVPQED